MKSVVSSLVLFVTILFVGTSHAQSSPGCTMEVPVTDTIGPASLDVLKRSQSLAVEKKCVSILLLINTPGGSLDSTRSIVELILNSPIPYLCLVHPSGAHAGSAGAIILQACHVNGGVLGTNLGAATPVAMGQELPKDLRQKIMNDTKSWLESLTKLRGRSDQFGQDIIVDAKAVSAQEAVRLKAIDHAGNSKEDFLNFSKGRDVKMPAGALANVEVGELEKFELDTRYKVLSFFTDPEFAYMLLLGSLGLLYFEITHPGTMIAGVAGGVGLVIALIALNKLEVEWGGVFLIILAVGLLIAELFLPTFGILGIGGIVALTLGSIFLFDPVKTGGYTLPLSIILPTVLFFSALAAVVGFLVIKALRRKKIGGFSDLIGQRAKVVKVSGKSDRSGTVEIQGEFWNFESDSGVHPEDTVIVDSHRGLILYVKRED